MRRNYWYFVSIVGAALATLLVAGRPGTANNSISGKSKEVCCKAKAKDCIKKERENPMIMEGLSRQFIFIGQ